MIIFHEKTKDFHLTNGKISYIFTILRNGKPGQLYFGKAIQDRNSFEHLLLLKPTVMAPCPYKGDLAFSQELIKQEYPDYGSGDYREPAFQIELEDGTRVSNFVYTGHTIFKGKNPLLNMPATFGGENEVTTLEVELTDSLAKCKMFVRYHLFEDLSVITRETEFVNNGSKSIKIKRALSASIDFPDMRYEMVQLDGAWARERHIHTRRLQYGVQSISSSRGASSAESNPFFALKRPETTEQHGEVYGVTLVYSGNFLAQVEVDKFDIARAQIGINPFEFTWNLAPFSESPANSFQTPEAVLVYSDNGLNGMSQTFHTLFRNHLMCPEWAHQTRPILINNWEATYFDFNEQKILDIASKAKKLGIEMFVLDDGWFGKRNSDKTSLGDWFVNKDKLPMGISGLSKKITAMGLKFGLWFEPEMVNEISDLFKTKPEWVIGIKGRNRCYGRNQYVLDFANSECVDFIFNSMSNIISNADISYIKWDMNRNITEPFSETLSSTHQTEFFHRYILGVYSLYAKLRKAFPNILFESCSAGGARFDSALLFYAPQAWTSDNTDAIERLEIQRGTSMLYPVVCMGSHVSAVPNHQVSRVTSLKTRADVAYFGTFGYELDVTKMDVAEQDEVKKQIAFFKKYRNVIQLGTFYRLAPGGSAQNGTSSNKTDLYAWMCVSDDKKTAVVAYYKVLATPNPALRSIKLQGLDPTVRYVCRNEEHCMDDAFLGVNTDFIKTVADEANLFYGDELMNTGFLCDVEFSGSDESCGQPIYRKKDDKGDFTSHLFVFEAE